VPIPQSLAQLAVGTPARVLRLRPAQEASDLHLDRRLMEVGFVEGEPVRVIAHGHPGREPIAVRIGGTTFALRRFEADRVLVTQCKA
jgi:ferrous iron transport protein A